MKDSFLHIIITPFNLKLYKHDKGKKQVCSPEWMNERMHLFQTYCLPSIKAQTCKDFKWLIMFDADTDNEIRKRMDDIALTCPNIRLVYLTEEEAVSLLDNNPKTGYSLLEAIINQETKGNEGLIVTTNLDNDDALHCNYIQNVHDYIHENNHKLISQKVSLLSYVWGYQFFPSYGVLLKMRYPHNHFLTLISKREKNFKTISHYPHTRARKIVSNTDVITKPMWMEVVHERNVNNDLRFTSRIWYLPVLLGFSFNEFGRKDTISFCHNLYAFLFRFPSLFCRTAIVRLKKKIKKSTSHR